MTAVRSRWAALAATVLVFSYRSIAGATPPTATIVSVVQPPGTKLVAITHTLASDADCMVFVQVSTNNGVTYDLPAKSFSGNGYGANVKPGGGKKIVWDMGADWGGPYSKQVSFKVIANDGFACYLDHGDGTVTDTATGLMWTKNANHGMLLMDAATAYCQNLVFAGYSDWRLPSVQVKKSGKAELETLGHPGGGVPYEMPGTPFTGVQPGSYWSGVTNASDKDAAWCMYMGSGAKSLGMKTSASYVWPVRGGR